MAVMRFLSRLRLPTRKANYAVLQLEYFAWLLRHAPPAKMPRLAASAHPGPTDDMVLVERVRRAYQHSIEDLTLSKGMWDTTLYAKKREVDEALRGPDLDRAAQVLRNPGGNYHFYGFDSLVKGNAEAEFFRALNNSLDARDLFALLLNDCLISLAEAVGARCAAYPEAGPAANDAKSPPASADDLLDAIERQLGIRLTFPTPYPNERGLQSRRGIVAGRAIHAVYQAWRIAQLARNRHDFRVLEIGAGLGRTAYFASLFGITDYTIVDIPLTNAAQGYFLGRTLSEGRVSLPGEAASGPLRIVAAGDLSALDEPFDLVFNADSWTELAPEVANQYWEFSRKHSRCLLSINHEFNPHTVRSLYAGDSAVTALRYPYWMRRGYIEEHLTW